MTIWKFLGYALCAILFIITVYITIVKDHVPEELPVKKETEFDYYKSKGYVFLKGNTADKAFYEACLIGDICPNRLKKNYRLVYSTQIKQKMFTNDLELKTTNINKCFYDEYLVYELPGFRLAEIKSPYNQYEINLIDINSDTKNCPKEFNTDLDLDLQDNLTTYQH